MNINKKFYATPEVDIEKFIIHCDTIIISDPNNGLEENGNDYVGGDDWDF